MGDLGTGFRDVVICSGCAQIPKSLNLQIRDSKSQNQQITKSPNRQIRGVPSPFPMERPAARLRLL
jgi:hypothetical protein